MLHDVVEQGVSLDTQTQSGAPRAARPTRMQPDRGRRPDDRISVQLAAGPSAAAWARNALTALDERVEPDLLADLRLLVSELVTNSVRHSAMAPAETVGLDVSVRGETVRVEVRDSGTGFEPRARVPGQSKAGGWGLFLVEKLADRWGVACNKFTRVWFEIDHAGTPAGA